MSERFRKEAKRWLKALREHDAQAQQRFERALPKPPPVPHLRAVQHALALEQGCESWSALKEREEHVARAVQGSAALLDELLQAGCVFSGGPLDVPAKWQRAERIRVRHPELARTDLHAAVLCGELETVERLLGEDPSVVHKKAGPQGWEPLLVLCYGRLQLTAAVEIAQRLLDAGADPSSAFITKDEWQLRFCALTGLMGRGEMDVLEHPSANALARLLLERGANPNPSQGLYNTCLHDDELKWLELLSQHGLDASAPIGWDANAEPAPGGLFSYLLVAAAKNVQPKRLHWLLEHGADPNARSTYTGKSAHQTALIAGQPLMAAELERYGARVEPLSGVFAFTAACMQHDAAEAARLLALDLSLSQSSDALVEAVERGNVEALRLLLTLGVDPNKPDRHGRLALHMGCASRTIAELLYSHAADPRARCYGGTATEWAIAHDPELARMHAEHSRELFDAVLSGHVELAAELLSESPERARQRGRDGDTPLHVLPADSGRAEALITLLLANGADANARNDAGHAPAEKLDARGLDEIADLLNTG